MKVMTQNKIVPKLRFKLKGEEWFYKKIGDICIVKTGGKDTQDRKESGKYPFFVRSNTVEKIDSFSFDGEAILTSGDGVGVGKNFHYINDKFDYHQRVYALHTFEEGFSGKFIFQVFKQKFYRRVMRLSAKNSVDSVRMSMITDMEIAFPSFPEQQKIASFLSAVDEKLQQLTKKKELLEEYKIGVMQKIFSQELRFKDANGNNYPDWEEKNLRDIIKLQGGNAFKSSQFKREGIPIIRISNISNKTKYLDLKKLVYYSEQKNDVNYIISKGDLLIAMSGATTGKSSISNFDVKAYLNQRVGLFKSKTTELEYGFLIQFVFSKIFLRQLDGVLVAGAQPNISSKDIENFKCELPQLKEQKKIANFLSSLDSKIDLVSTQIENTKAFKKGLLQQMFV